jgi:hypothetical protein
MAFVENQKAPARVEIFPSLHNAVCIYHILVTNVILVRLAWVVQFECP